MIVYMSHRVTGAHHDCPPGHANIRTRTRASLYLTNQIIIAFVRITTDVGHTPVDDAKNRNAHIEQISDSPRRSAAL